MSISSAEAAATGDGFAAIQVVLREREARDRRWWEDMRECFAPDSTVALTWYEGSGYGFVDGSAEMSRRRHPSRHRISPPVVRLSGDRAVISLPIIIEGYASVDGIDCVIGTYARHLYRLQRIDGAWKIVALDAIYERDELAPATPGQEIRIDPAELEGLRAPYRLLAWNLRRANYEVSQDLPADVRPEHVARMYREAFDWAGIPEP
ncbi:MAG: nuclear transport factor 2 family protein [Solirubrobacteraceae bacterium]